MNFKRIEMAGFKSFADKTEINFDSGITAIVGPNGCGKSNVADCVRWVLGEQSSKQLRGNSMQDVIFKGTQNRKSLSFCEVSLVFDNSDHTLDVDYDELIITRKLYRSGESEYCINRTPCRLKDIVDLLHDSGIGREGYSIIGQGKVAEIIGSKPENRRAIFEEAAGIAKFKSRKLETERKLERAHESMNILNVQLTEVEKQLGPLKKQAEVAKQCFALRDELRNLEINAYLYQSETAFERKSEINEKIEQTKEALELKQKQLEDCNNKYDVSMEKIQVIDKNISIERENILSHSVRLEKLAGQTKLLQERMDFMKEQSNRIQSDIDSTTAEIEQNQKLKKNKQVKLQENTKKLRKLQLDAEKLSNDYLALVDELTANEDAVDKHQRMILESMDKLADIKANLSRLQTQKDALYNLSETKQVRLNAILEKLEVSKKNKLESDEISAKIQKENDDLKLKLDVVKSQIQEQDSIEFEASENLSIERASYASYESRHKFLTELQTDYEGFAHSVKQLMRDADKNKELKEKIVGVVANLIQVPEKFQTAIEIALGNAIQNIVTENEYDAKKLVAHLKENRYGRATFLPISTMKPRFVDAYMRPLFREQGVFGVASELVGYDDKLKNVFQSLLGGTVIVDTMDTAVELANKAKYSFKIVSLDGDVINPQGSMTGGSKKAEVNNILGREKEIQMLYKEMQKKQEKMREYEAKIQECRDKINELENISQGLEQKIYDNEIALAKHAEGSQKINAIYMENQMEADALRAEIAGHKAEAQAIEKDINSVDELENTIKNSRMSADASINEKQSQFDLLKVKKDEFNKADTALRVEIATVESEISAFNNDIESLDMQINALNQKVERLNESLTQSLNKEKSEKDKLASNEQEQEYLDLTEKLEKAKEKIGDFEKEKQDHQVALKLIEQDRVLINADLNRVQEKKIHHEMELQKIDDELKMMGERILEEYELDLESCKQFKDENFDYKEKLPEINNIKKEIAKLGYVNFNAIEESKIQSERYEELSKQMEDLTRTEEDCLTIIRELSTEMISKFDYAFNKINQNFSKTFRELFGGGSGQLVLTEAEDPLNAGVEIMVEPPGKKITNLSLLSGGEQALTAIAILFAILKLRPMPFCLLDEIEAALDDANVQRFAKYLHRFSEETQFIVITHRKPTMELADRLYGVSMEERGVSSILSVKLEDAEAMADTTAN